LAALVAAALELLHIAQLKKEPGASDTATPTTETARQKNRSQTREAQA